jgi:threonine aldolase
VHSLGLRLHLDGARLANAAAGLGVTLREVTTDVGVDAVSFGGTKNGAMGAEAVIVLNPDLAAAVPFLRKSAMQLASKMRFISAQLSALLTDDLWLRNARHANAMARRLESAVRAVPGVEIVRRVDANAVFAVLPSAATERLQRDYRFYTWDDHTGEVRWMCSWDTTESDVDAFAAAIDREMRG